MTEVEQPNREELEEAQLVSRREAMVEAEALLRACKSGVLSTLSKRAEGWPFGSIVPFAVSRDGEPIILIARIAEHTKNIVADPRVSLLVHEPAGEGDVQSKGRLTVMGLARPVAEADREDAAARYLARLPEASGYSGTHDFAYYAISLERLRYIGGFGKIFWLEPAGLGPRPDDPIAAAAPGVLEHMNADHEDALRLMAKAFRGVEAARAKMVGLDPWGFDVRTEGPAHRLRFEFSERATPDNIRRLMVGMTAEARKRG